MKLLIITGILSLSGYVPPKPEPKVITICPTNHQCYKAEVRTND